MGCSDSLRQGADGVLQGCRNLKAGPLQRLRRGPVHGLPGSFGERGEGSSGPSDNNHHGRPGGDGGAGAGGGILLSAPEMIVTGIINNAVVARPTTAAP